MRVDKNIAASVALHVLVLGYGMVSFSSRSLEAPPPESMPVDIISADQLSKLTAGSKSGDKDKPKPLVDKIADAKPVDDLVGKITEKPPVETEAAPAPKPPVEKPVEKKPDPPKPVVENKPKDEPKPVEKKPDPPKVDPIAEALKHEDTKKPAPKAEAKAAAPAPQKPKERVFDATKLAALLDKRDPSRQAATGTTLNSQASLGASRGTAVTLSQSELDAMRARLQQLWNVQAGTERPEELVVEVRIKLTRERKLAAPPEIVSRGSSPRYQAAADAAVRAVLQGQPYTMLRDETYAQWQDIVVTFDPRQMFHS
ncbi:MAG TPA: protein TolA [Bradyrhizobium sp.]|nr:protein TolA [Bradyrhizobium sp.]